MARENLSLVKPIGIEDLLLDEENPRLEGGQSQPDILSSWSRDRKNIRLAADLAENGLSPIEPFAVIRHPTLSRRFIVLDGNRRTAALKLLSKPSLAAEDQVATRLRQIAKHYAATIPRKAPCIIFQSREAADLWIARRHSGESDGVGTVSWGTLQKYRFNARRLKFDPNAEAVQVLALARESGWITEEQQRAIRVTTLRRVLATARDLIGIELTQDGPVISRPAPEAKRVMSRILGALTKKGVVRELDRQEQRTEFVSKLIAEALAAPGGGGSKTSVGVPTPKPLPIKPKPVKPKGRSTLAPTGLNFTVNHYRCNLILGELQSLRVEQAANALVVLFRVFVELTVGHYLAEKKVAKPGENASLHTKITKCIHSLATTQFALSASQRQAIEKVLANPHHPLHPNTLNAFVHNPDFFPLGSDLPKMWDQMEAFVSSVWRALESP